MKDLIGISMLRQNSQSHARAQAEEVTLRLWEEAAGSLEEVSRSSSCVKVVIRLGPKRVALLIPADNLVGVVPNRGTNVAIMRTENGFRIRSPREGEPTSKRGRDHGEV